MKALILYLLCELLARQGVTSTAAVLATMLSGQAVIVAPVGLAASVAGTALPSAGTSAGAGLTFLKLVTMTKNKNYRWECLVSSCGFIALRLLGPG